MNTNLRYILIFAIVALNSFLWISNKPTKNPTVEKEHSEKIISSDEQFADSLMKESIKLIRQGEYNEAQINIYKCIEVYRNNKELKKLGISLNKLGTSYYYLGNYNVALIYFNESINCFHKVGYSKGEASVLNNIGAICYFLGDYPEALEFYKKALKLQEELNDQKLIANLNQNIGGVYLEIDDVLNSMLYLEKALNKFQELNNEEGISLCLNGIGEVYLRSDEIDKAHSAFLESEKIANKLGNKQRKMEVLYNLGNLHLKQKNYNGSISYMQNCLAIADEINSLRFSSISNIAIAQNLHETNRDYEAIKYAKKGLETASEIKALSIKKDAFKCLYEIYKSLGESSLALQYYEKTNAYEDSLRKDETANKILNMEFQKQTLIDSLAYAKKEFELQQIHQEEIHRKEKQRNIFIASILIVLILTVSLWSRLHYVRKSKSVLQIEKDRSESLLLNILPEEIAAELKEKGYVDARDFNLVSILFTDFKEFTQTSEKLTPHDLVEEINVCFKEFDSIVERYRLEKIKTIGDAYMAAGGLPNPDNNAVKNIVLAGIEMQNFIGKRKIAQEEVGKQAFEMRLGIHAGPIVAGIVGVKKFQYDVWGDTVNTASRIETNGEVGKVNVSEVIYQLLKDEPAFHFEYRGLIKAKGKGEMKMYFVDNESLSNFNA